MSRLQQHQEGLYPIGVVSEMTGVNTVTLRAWERRYGLLIAQRSPTGRRLYSQADIEAIHQVLALMDKGIPISRVGEALKQQQQSSEPLTEQAPCIWQRALKTMLESIELFDEIGLDETYNEILSLYPIDMVTHRLLIPLLTRLGLRWHNQETDTPISQEHFFGVYLRNKLGARFHHRQHSVHGPTLLGACLPGEQHDTGLLMFGLSAQEKGYRMVLLGANMPLDELPLTAERCRASAIILSSSLPPTEQLLKQQLPGLIAKTAIPVFVGGKTTREHSLEYAGAGLITTGDDLSTGLRQITRHLDGLYQRT